MVNGICFKFSILPVGIQMGKKNETTKFCEYIYIYIYMNGLPILESDFWKTTFQTFLCLFVIEKIGQRKTLSSQRKI